jgi:hypothetical protein
MERSTTARQTSPSLLSTCGKRKIINHSTNIYPEFPIDVGTYKLYSKLELRVGDGRGTTRLIIADTSVLDALGGAFNSKIHHTY